MLFSEHARASEPSSVVGAAAGEEREDASEE